jgi:hypothetical protein
MLRPLPFRDPGRLVWIANTGTSGLSGVTSRTSNLRDYRAQARSFEAITGYFAFFEYGGSTLLGAGAPERRQATAVAVSDRAPSNRLASAAGFGALNR